MKYKTFTHFIEVWRTEEYPAPVHAPIEDLEELDFLISNYTIAIFKIRYK